MAGHESHGAEIDLRRFLDLAGSLLVVAGFDTTIRWLSPSYARILGFEPSQMVGLPFTEFIHPKDREEVLEQTRLLVAGHAIGQVEYRIRAADGSYKRVVTSALGVPEERLVYAVTQDVTELREVESLFESAFANARLAMLVASVDPSEMGRLTAANGAELPPVFGFRSVAGRGAEGEVGGKRYLIGSPRLFSERGIALDGAGEALGAVERAGETPVVLGDDDSPLAVFGLSDSLRPDAKATVEALRASGVGELVMLTGDAEAPARRVAEELGIGHRSRLLPEQKIEAVRELVAEHGDAGMVGDGVNDAPALAASSVGFAMGAAGTDVALETADVALMQDDLPKLAEAVRLSRSAERIIRQNVAVSIAIKGLFVLLAPFGLVALWLAVLADMGTSIAVTLNGLRLFRKGGR